MRKTFVLDTNVLLHDPAALTRFEDNNILIPIEVVEEIDRFKRDPAEKGRNARQVLRLLDGLRSQGNLADGINRPGLHQRSRCDQRPLSRLL
jgi:PhoH-like ATPase